MFSSTHFINDQQMKAYLEASYHQQRIKFSNSWHTRLQRYPTNFGPSVYRNPALMIIHQNGHLEYEETGKVSKRYILHLSGENITWTSNVVKTLEYGFPSYLLFVVSFYLVVVRSLFCLVLVYVVCTLYSFRLQADCQIRSTDSSLSCLYSLW